MRTIKRFIVFVGLYAVSLSIYLSVVKAKLNSDIENPLLTENGVTFGLGYQSSEAVSVRLEGSKVDSEIAELLLYHPKIRTLTFKNTRIRKGVFPHLTKITHLESIHIENSILDSIDEFAAFFQQKQLRTIDLIGLPSGDRLLESMNKSRLESIQLNGCENLTIDAIERLAESPHLKKLNFSGVPLSRTVRARMKEKRPDLNLVFNPADFIELKPLVEAGGEFHLDSESRIVGMKLTEISRKIPANSFDLFSHLKWIALENANVGSSLLKTISSFHNLQALSLKGSIIPTITSVELIPPEEH